MIVVEEIRLLELYDIYVHYFPVWMDAPFERISYWCGQIMLNDDVIICTVATIKKQVLNDCVELAKHYIYDTARSASSDI